MSYWSTSGDIFGYLTLHANYRKSISFTMASNYDHSTTCSRDDGTTAFMVYTKMKSFHTENYFLFIQNLQKVQNECLTACFDSLWICEKKKLLHLKYIKLCLDKSYHLSKCKYQSS